MSVQAPAKPTGQFAAVEQSGLNLSGSVGSAGTAKKAELIAKNVSIGWLGQDGGEWCVVTSQDAAVSIEPYIENNVLYYRNSADTSRYLSVSNNGYVGFYNKHGSTGWTYDDKTEILTSLFANAQLSYWSTDNGYIYANADSGYTPLLVRFR